MPSAKANVVASTGIVKKIKKAKVAVFTTALDIAQTETKGTVLLHNAQEMLNFTSGEEKHMEKVRSVPDITTDILYRFILTFV